jgi:hypothetical protein
MRSLKRHNVVRYMHSRGQGAVRTYLAHSFTRCSGLNIIRVCVAAQHPIQHRGTDMLLTKLQQTVWESAYFELARCQGMYSRKVSRTPVSILCFQRGRQTTQAGGLPDVSPP